MVLRFATHFNTLFAVPIILMCSFLVLFATAWIGIRFLDYIERKDND
jgi:hypothetical protein